MARVREPLQPGEISPPRGVPPGIPRPEYVGKPRPTAFTGTEVKDADTIAAMRIAGSIAARALAEVGAAIVPGVTTDELDRIGHEFLLDHGAYPSTLGYRGYPKSLCTSVNEVICHGIPDSTVLQDGLSALSTSRPSSGASTATRMPPFPWARCPRRLPC